MGGRYSTAHDSARCTIYLLGVFFSRSWFVGSSQLVFLEFQTKGFSLDISRREFVALSASAAAAASLPNTLTALGQGQSRANLPWHQKIRRAGQVNITEHDPAVLNVEEWADYWASLKCDVVFASVTGIIAYYPTEVPFHRQE